MCLASGKFARWARKPCQIVFMLSVTLGIAHTAVLQWQRCPPARVLEVERLTGISRYRLRPDIFGPRAPAASRRETAASIALVSARRGSPSGATAYPWVTEPAGNNQGAGRTVEFQFGMNAPDLAGLDLKSGNVSPMQ